MKKTANAECKPINAAAAVAYSPGSIVSKTLLENKAGSLTVFAFDRGQGLSEHVAPFDAVVQVIDGEADLVIGGRPVTVTAGHIAIMPANVPHALSARKRFKMLLTMIRQQKGRAG